MADVSRTPDSPPRCHCGGPEEQLYGHAYGFGRHCRDQVAAVRPAVDPTRPLPDSAPVQASVSHITDDTRAHALKTWPQYWRAVQDGSKTFELRRDDRSFQVGDVLLLQEWDPDTEGYTGRELRRQVSYVIRDAPEFGLREGFVVLGLSGAAVGCTAATAGAPVSPVQTTDHADLSVSGVTDEMLESAALAVGGFLLAVDEDQVEGDGRTICREGACRVLSAALAGCTVTEPTHALVRTRIGVGRSLVSLAYSHDEAVTQVNAARRESELRDYIEIVPIERAGGSQVGDQHAGEVIEP